MPEEKCECGINKKDSLVPASILIGAIIIALSICWSAGKIGTGGILTGGDNKTKITERKDAPQVGTGKVKIIEFSDFQCPYCQQFYNVAYKEIKSKYIDTGKVSLVYRHYLIPSHKNAPKAAEAAECANGQGKFEIYYDALFTNTSPDGTGIAVPDLKKYAKELGLDENAFNQCLDSGEMVPKAQQDAADGQKAGVTGTPTFFINGEKLIGAQPFSVFQAAIEKALK